MSGITTENRALPPEWKDAATRGVFERLRREMVERQIRARGILDERVLAAMHAAPRHEFVPQKFQSAAYRDEPLPIGEGQTISQPFMVAAMAEAAELVGAERVLEIGTGCGYQAAVLSLLAGAVESIECIPLLALEASERLARLGCANVRVHSGDGSLGLPECAPYEAIVVTAAAPGIPPPLVEQLAEGGRLVIPVGTPNYQELIRVRKQSGRTSQETLHYCRFVPLLGRYGWSQPSKS